MLSLNPLLRWRLTAVFFAAVAGCETRVIDLYPDAAVPLPPGAQCEWVKRADGLVCRVCLLPDGNVFNAGCQPAAGTPPQAGNSSQPGSAPPVGAGAAECKVESANEPRCLQCFGAGVTTYQACLKCETLVATSAAGDGCRACMWSDKPERRCLQCLSATGVITSDDCDSLRTERLPGR